MKFIVRAVLSAAFLFAAGYFPALADGAAQKFVTGIYAQYGGPDTPGVVLETREIAERYFTPEIIELMEKDGEQAAQNDTPPALDGDPFVGAQDWDIKNVAVSVTDISPDKAVALVTFVNQGEQKLVQLDLKKLEAGWRIDDIRWSDGTLRGLYKSNPDKPTPGQQNL
jgi:hypothetical protein